MTTVSFGVAARNASIQYINDYDAETELQHREGWEYCFIPVIHAIGPISIPANCYRNLFAVHRMLGPEPDSFDPGFTISIMENKEWFRVSSGGRVFGKSSVAMELVEMLFQHDIDWTQLPQFPEPHRTIFNKAHDDIERKGYMLRDLVYPI